jgi:NAD+ kinase
MKFGIVGNSHKERFSYALSTLIDKLESNGTDYLIDEAIASERTGSVKMNADGNVHIVAGEDLYTAADIIIALGGDGTILRYARAAAMHHKPILGVNLGKLGFLAEVSIPELPECIDEILRGDYNVSPRLAVSCTVQGIRHDPIFGINDIVIDRGGLLRVIDVETYVDDDYLITFKGDGLIVSTPTGSTGYSLSCGGPIVAPDTDVFIVTPVSPHTLNARPVIIPASKTVRAVVFSPDPTVQIAADGLSQGSFASPVEMVFGRSDIEVHLIKRKIRSFYDVLRDKLMWGRDVRVNPKKSQY